MRLTALILTLFASVAVLADITNATSAVDVRGWKRSYVYGTDDGRIIDPSGQIADGTVRQTLIETQARFAKVVAAAKTSSSNEIAKLYAVTNNLQNYKKRIFVQVHLYPNLHQHSNVWSYAAREWTDGTNDHVWVYFSKKLIVPPVMKRVYRSETQTNVVEGVWTDFKSEGITIDGYEGCRELVYKRPDDVVGRVTFRNPYINFGTKENGFDFGTRVFTINGETFYTGMFTNSLRKINRWNNGVKVGGELDVEE